MNAPTPMFASLIAVARFCTCSVTVAPEANSELTVNTRSVPSALPAAIVKDTATAPEAAAVVVATSAVAMVPLLIASLLRDLVLVSSSFKLIASLAALPTWNVSVPKLPSNSFLPPKAVVLEIRSSSFFSSVTSEFKASRSLSPFEPFAACRERSRMR